MEALPDGIRPKAASLRSYSSNHVKGYAALPATGRTFDVQPRHEIIARGVRFAVEDVSPASEEDRAKPVLQPDALRKSRMRQALAFYASNEEPAWNHVDFTPMRIEAESTCPVDLVYAGPDGFLAACLTAFARHLPLALKPDHVWALIAYGFARHVDQNAEALRGNFVQHEGKKRLKVLVDHFTMSGGVPGAGTPAELWESDVFPDFSRQIREHIGGSVHDTIAAPFSTSDGVSRATHEITLMSAMKNYFSLSMSTRCGIPDVTLLGSQDDWTALRARTERLGEMMLPEFAANWLGPLLPVLDQFERAYAGEVNHGFWQSMVKLRDTGGRGSGSHSFISGWIQLLYPYLTDGSANRTMRPWDQMYFTGVEPQDFPPVTSAAPVDWEYYGETHDLHFHAGFVGTTQDPETGTLTPQLGWHVTFDPPQDPEARVLHLRAEIAALTAGHALDRVATLESQLRLLETSREAIERQHKINQLGYSCQERAESMALREQQEQAQAALYR